MLVRRRSSARWTSIKSQISGRWARRSAVGWSAMRIWRWWDSGMTRRLMARDHFSLLGHQLLCRLNWREGWAYSGVLTRETMAVIRWRMRVVMERDALMSPT